MPFGSISKRTSIWGTPRGAGGMPTSSKRASVLLSADMSRSPWRTWTDTSGWLSTAVEKTCPFFTGTVVFLGMMRVKTPPAVSTPSDRGVTSSRRTSFTSPLRTPPWMAAPTATTSSGLTPLCGSLPKNFFTVSCTLGMRVIPPTRMTVSSWEAVRPASLRAILQGSMVFSTRSPTRLSSVARSMVSARCLGPVVSAVMKGRFTSVSVADDSSCLARSAASLSRCSAMRSLRRSMPVWSWKRLPSQSMSRWSKSSPPRKVSPFVALTSKTPWFSSRMVMSKVPPPRSYTATSSPLAVCCLSMP